MSLAGKIVELIEDGSEAKVLVKPVANCSGCKVCATLLKYSSIVNEEREVIASTKGQKVQKGDYVTLEMSDTANSSASVLIFGIPMVAFIAGLVLAPNIVSIFTDNLIDLHRVITAFLFMLISYLIVWFYLKTHKSRKFLLQITAITKPIES